MLDTILLIIVTLINTSLIALVLARDVRSTTNRLYALMAATVTIWSASNYFTNQVSSYSLQLFTNRLSFGFGFLTVASVWLFSCRFPKKLTRLKYENLFAYITTPIVLALCFTPLIISGVVYRPEEMVTDIVTGSLYPIYLVCVGSFFLFTLYNFFRTYGKLDRISKAQTFYTSAGILLTFAWIVITSAVVPAITGDWEISKYGGIGTIMFVGLTAYAIIKHGLFDIRLIVTKAVAYIMLLATAALIFAILVISLPASIIGIDKPNLTRQVYYTVSAVALAFAFQPLKKIFDKLTNRLFYQDAYDAQTFLDELNKVLVSTIELNRLLHKVSDIIGLNIKAEFCLFGLKETASEGQRIIGTTDVRISKEDIGLARRTTPYIKSKVVLADEIAGDHKELHERMSANNIAALVRLAENTEDGQEGLGYIVLGHKKSGNPYNSQDVKVLEIIANELVIAIQNALRFEEIQNFNVKLQEEVKRATGQLQRTNAKLVALDETKDDFISMASHQLRTPLTSVKGYLSMVLEGDAGKVNPKQEKLLNQAFTSSQRMVYLIADLLNVSRLRTGKFVIEPKPTNLAEVIEGEVEQLKETASSRGLKLDYIKPKNFPELMLDETKIRQVIMNFTDNAIHYTQAGGHITVSLDETPETIQFTVKDDGIGVPKHEQHHLFTKFYRAGNARKARPDGTGLGLFMAKKVVIAQGGSILFKSQEGKGSTFGFTFAKARLKAPVEDLHSKTP